MAEERKRQGDDDSAAADGKRQKSEEPEGKEEHAADGGGKAVTDGEEILSWLVDHDEQSMREVMAHLLPPPPAAGAVLFASDPYSAPAPQPPSSSYVTINTANEESCGSSYSEAPSFMASLDAAGAPLAPIDGGGAGLPWFEALADDPDGGDFLTKFLAEDGGGKCK